MNCRHCGKPVAEGSVFCPFCGKKLESHLRAEDAYEEMDEYESGEPESKTERRAERKAERKARGKRRLRAFVSIIAAILFVVAAFIAVMHFAKPYLGEEPWGEEDQTAQEDGTDQLQEVKTMYVSAEDGVVLRSSPGEDGESIHIVNYGQEVKVEKTENDWAYVTAEGVSGWCSAGDLTEDKIEAAKKESAPSSDDDKGKLVEPSVRIENGQHWTVDSDGGLNLRCGPGQDYDILLVVPDKTEVAEEGRNGDWIYVKYEGQYGWINSGYIKPKA